MFVYLASLEEKRITVLEVFYLNFIMHGVFCTVHNDSNLFSFLSLSLSTLSGREFFM